MSVWSNNEINVEVMLSMPADSLGRCHLTSKSLVLWSATFPGSELVVCPQLVENVVTRNIAIVILCVIERLFKMAHKVQGLPKAIEIDDCSAEPPQQI